MVARMALVRIASVLPAFVSDPQAFPDRLFFSRAAAGYGHLLDAVLVASAFELRREVGVEHRHGLVVGDEAGREDDNVGVVVTADERCDLRFPRQSGADALMFVEGHGHPFARTAEGDAAFEFAFLDRFGQRTFPAYLGSMDLTALAIFLVGFVTLRKWKPSPIKVMAGAAVTGAALYSIAA